MRVNERIRSQTVRLIGPKGEQIGVTPISEALDRAEKAGLDLVEVAPSATPPVCRIIDFGKYLYEQEKKERNAKKKQVVIHVKELRFRPKIGDHDYQTKLRNAEKFLERGDRVKVNMMFRGRELAHIEAGEKILARLLVDLKDVAEVEKNYGFENRSIVYVLSPKKLGKKPPVKKSPAEKDAATESEEESEPGEEDKIEENHEET